MNTKVPFREQRQELKPGAGVFWLFDVLSMGTWAMFWSINIPQKGGSLEVTKNLRVYRK